MDLMKITYDTEKAFYDGIMELILRSLKFKADHGSLTITLTGGF